MSTEQMPEHGCLLLVCDECGTRWRQGCPTEWGRAGGECRAQPRKAVPIDDPLLAIRARSGAQDEGRTG